MSRSRERRVVVTGLGCVSPIGNTVAESWAALIEGKSGIATITKFDATPFSTRFAGEVKDFNIEVLATTDDPLDTLDSHSRKHVKSRSDLEGDETVEV